MAYNSGKEQLLFLEESGGRVTRSSQTLSVCTNGLSYNFVDLTCKDGSHYAIEAYGDESSDLHQEMLRRKDEVLVAESIDTENNMILKTNGDETN